MMWAAAAVAQTLWCTDLGPLALDGTGPALTGTASHRWDVSGTPADLSITDGGVVLFQGPLADLNPTPARPSADAVAARLASMVPGWTSARTEVTGGGFAGHVGPDGILRGRNGRTGEVWSLDGDGGLFGGPVDPSVDLAEVHRRYGTGAASWRAVVADHAARVGAPLGCSASGTETIRVGLWPDPVALGPGQRAVWTSTSRVVLRNEAGLGTVYSAIPMDRALAASVAAELAGAAAGRRIGVGWRRGVALLAVSADPDAWLPDDVDPQPGPTPVLWSLNLILPPDVAPRPSWPGLDGGAEAVAVLARWRSDAGLPPLVWDDDLALAALQHASYLSANGIGPHNHEQDPKAPLFLGSRPVDRGGAREVILAGYPGSGPDEAIAAWLIAPLHRVPLLHPLAERIGAANVGGVWVAEITPGPRDRCPPPGPPTAPWRRPCPSSAGSIPIPCRCGGTPIGCGRWDSRSRCGPPIASKITACSSTTIPSITGWCGSPWGRRGRRATWCPSNP